MRICSLLPSATEIVFSLGLGDQVVGVTHECDYPPEARRKTIMIRSAVDARHTASQAINRTVGEQLRSGRSLYQIDLSRFKEADPDLIITQELCDVCAVDHRDVSEAALSLPRQPRTITLGPRTLFDVLRDIVVVGQATGKTSEAELLVGRLRARIERVREGASSSDIRPKVACLEWLDPIYVAGHWVPDMVDLAGGTDGLARQGEPSERVEWGRIVEYAPEIMILMPCGFDVERTLEEVDLLYGLPGWGSLPAIRNGQLYAVNGGAFFSRPGPRLTDGLEILAHIIHPEIFPQKAAPADAKKLI